jgi:hypothetical protein
MEHRFEFPHNEVIFTAGLNACTDWRQTIILVMTLMSIELIYEHTVITVSCSIRLRLVHFEGVFTSALERQNLLPY